MRKLYLIAAVLLAPAAAPHASAQQQKLPAQFSSWSGQPGPMWVETEAALNYVDLWKETGRTPGEFCEYSSGGAKIDVDLQKYRDPSSAYEMYTALIRPDMHPSTLDKTSAVDGDRLFVLVGSSILHVRPAPAISTADLLTLVNSVSAHADQTPLPAIRTFLPRGFTDGTQRYAHGPAAFVNALASLRQDEFANLAGEAGFPWNAEAMFAHYRAGKDEAVLLLIEYPTPQLAEQHLRHLELALSPAAKLAGTTMERRGSLLSAVLKPSSTAYGASLRSAVKYETEVTWNEPRQTVTDPPILTSLVKIILGTCLFMVVAVVLGVAFGGVRVVAKILFPGKVFDRPEQMDVLQLGLSSKRINSRDFY
jgi:Family of unknown function (DUF6599)